jgi:hypothetical protein
MKETYPMGTPEKKRSSPGYGRGEKLIPRKLQREKLIQWYCRERFIAMILQSRGDHC